MRSGLMMCLSFLSVEFHNIAKISSGMKKNTTQLDPYYRSSGLNVGKSRKDQHTGSGLRRQPNELRGGCERGIAPARRRRRRDGHRAACTLSSRTEDSKRHKGGGSVNISEIQTKRLSASTLWPSFCRTAISLQYKFNLAEKICDHGAGSQMLCISLQKKD